MTLLKAEGLPMSWVGGTRALLLALGVAWSARLAWSMARERGTLSSLVAAGGVVAASSAVVWLWIEMFYLW